MTVLNVDRALIECHMDAGRRSDATTVATAAAVFIKKHVPSLYKKIFGLMVSLFLWVIFGVMVSVCSLA